VLSGGKAVNTTVLSGGKLVYAGGTVSVVTIKSGGIEAFTSGVKAAGTIVGAGVTAFVSGSAKLTTPTVKPGGTLVLQSGTVSGATVNSGRLVVSSGSLSGATIGGGGILTVVSAFSGIGTTAGVKVLSGGEIVLDGPWAVPTWSIASGGKEVAVSGAVLGNRTCATLQVAGGNLAFAAENFGGLDKITLASFKFGTSQKLSFVENAATTSGTLTVTDGAMKATITLFGQYGAAGFHMAAAGAGTVIAYRAQPPA
jgi:autotransporter passenger strand-loop-strand repeat protein